MTMTSRFLATLCLGVTLGLHAIAAVPPLRILTYNIRTAFADEEDAFLRNDWPRRRPLALRMLKERQPDIVGIQEATDAQVADLAPGYAVLRKEELAILYRADRLEAQEGGFLTLGVFGRPDPWGDRWALWQVFRTRVDGKFVLVVMTHLSTAADQVPQAEQVIRLALDKGGIGLPTVVTGDFNFDAAGRLAEQGFRDAVRDRRGTFHAFKGGRSGPRLDNIGVSGCRVIDARVDLRRERRKGGWVYPSDHYPVEATLQLPDAAVPLTGLRATWEHLGPLQSGQTEGGSKLQLRLENCGHRPLPARGWSLFVNSAHVLRAVEGSTVTVEHLGGDFHRLRPTEGFKGLDPGKTEAVGLWSRSTLANQSAVPQGAYLVDDRKPERRASLETVAVLPFPVAGSSAEQIAAERFEQNAAVRQLPLEELPPVFPTPVSFQAGSGECRFPAMPRILAPPALASEARLLASYLRPWLQGPILRRGPVIRLELGELDGLEGPEAYQLVVDPQAGVRIRGWTAAGVFRGLQTLRGLLPLRPGAAGLTLQALTVLDAPRFGYRGLHLDVARNFQPKESILRVLDLMAQYKLNVFHFHLTDDEGWRLEIRGLPELTTVGARRGHDLVAARWLPPAYGSGPFPDRAFGSGFFSRGDYRQILRHAQRLHIEVIPELEMPGHARAAIKAMEARYHRLLEQGRQLEAERYRLAEPEDASEYTSAQNYRDNVMNPALSGTYAFLAKVVSEVALLHREAGVPLKNLHLGGDEVPTGAWEHSPRAQALMKIRGWTSVDALWPMFYERVGELLRPHGIPVSGWEEMALHKVESEGKKAQVVNPSFALRGWRAYVWNNVPGWGNEDLAYRLANAGFPVVLCPVTNFYFDLAATPEPGELGLRWGGILDVDKPFDFIPMDYYRSTRQDHLGRPLDAKVFDGKARLSSAGRKQIIGLQGCLWSETLTEDGRLEHMLLPKLLGLAERAWAPDPLWATMTDGPLSDRLHQEDWTRFLNILGQRELPRLALQKSALRFRIPAPGLKVVGGRVQGNHRFPGMTLRYTLDGTEPAEASPVFTGNLPAVGRLTVAAFDAAGRRGAIQAITFRGQGQTR